EPYKIATKTIDGNDVRVVHAAAGEAIVSVRRGDGPFLLECMTHRMAGHFVGDAQHYRSKEELAAMREKDPIERLKRHLLAQGAAQSALDDAGERAKRQVQEAVERARAAPRPAPATVGEYVYKSAA